MHFKFTGLAAVVKSFVQHVARARRGNVAMIFAIVLVPVLITGGAGIDLARAMAVRTKLYAAVDAAALAVASKNGITQTQANTLAQQYFNANYKLNSSFGTPAAVSVNLVGQSVTVSTQTNMPTTLMGIAGFQNVNLTASSNVVWGQTRIWVGLALDNTGSMCEPSSQSLCNGTNTKIYALKTATHALISKFQSVAATPGDVQVSLIPFSRDVNVGVGYAGANWIDWSEWDEDHGSCSVAGFNTKSSCEAAGNGTCSIGGAMSQSSCNTQGTCSVAGFTSQSACTNTSTGGVCNLPSYTSKSTCQAAVGACSVGGFTSQSSCTNSTTGGVCNNPGNLTKSGCQSSGGYCSISSRITQSTCIAFACSNPSQTTQTNCTSNNACTLSAYTSKNPCQAAGGVWGKGTWSKGNWTTRTGVWTPGLWTAAVWTPGVWTAATFTAATWTADHSTWAGCITDRGGWESVGPSNPAYDTVNTAPTTTAVSKFPASDHSACPPATLMGVGYDWAALNAKVDTMVANGNTNQTIGLAWAWHSLSQGSPLSPPSLPTNTARHIIILSDGENTQNRWSSTRSTIDARMNTLCTNAKDDDVIIWSVFVNIAGTAGNAQSMKDCATGGANGGHYIEVTSSGGIGTAFDVISQQITNLRVAQ